jgi:hypothetical protein
VRLYRIVYKVYGREIRLGGYLECPEAAQRRAQAFQARVERSPAGSTPQIQAAGPWEKVPLDND